MGPNSPVSAADRAIASLAFLPVTATVTQTQMPSVTIKLFLVHGDAKRLRTAELSNWTGKAIARPRSELDGVLG
jgi:hypothetical protein